MHEKIISIIAAYFDIDRQLPDDSYHLSTLRLRVTLPGFLRNLAAIAVPEPEVSVFLWIFTERLGHHVFMIAKQYSCIGHVVQFLQYFKPIRMPVNTVAQHIQMVVWLKVNLAHDAFISCSVPVYIRHHMFLKKAATSTVHQHHRCLVFQ